MKTHHSKNQVSRDSFKKIRLKYGLIIAVLVLLCLLLETKYPLLSGVLAVAAVATLIMSFVSGYRHSDELEKLVQVRAASISFIAVMFMTFLMHVIETYNHTTYEGMAGTIFAIGFFLHLILLPGIAKRTYEK